MPFSLSNPQTAIPLLLYHKTVFKGFCSIENIFNQRFAGLATALIDIDPPVHAVISSRIQPSNNSVPSYYTREAAYNNMMHSTKT